MGTDWIRQVSPHFGDDEMAATRRVLARGWITEGEESAAFVAELNALTGAPFGVLAPNGTLALALGLMAIGVGPGDEVLVPDITFVGSATAVVLAGARPVFVDVEPLTFQIDLVDAGARVTAATRAIMPVHLYGTACDMDALAAFAERHGIRVIEDAAQGIGVDWRGRHVGALGDVGCFSFFADKTITTGEGGYVACRDPAVFERLQLLRNQGRINRGSFVHPEIGYNFRMTDLQTAIGRVQLGRLDAIVARKRALYDAYVAGLADLDGVRVIGAAEGAGLVPFRCVVLARAAEPLMARLAEHRIEPRSFFYPLHRQPAFAHLGQADAPFPVADEGFARGVCLPLHGALTEADVERTCDVIREHQSGCASARDRARA